MTVRGRKKGGVVVLEESAAIPDGAEVTVEWREEGDVSNEELEALLLRHAGKGRDLPADLAAHHDHYAHGKPSS